VTSYLNMVVDWPFGTVCAFFIYLGLIYLVSCVLRCFRVPCLYEFEVLTK